jgi:hypothetical protein
MQDYGNITGKMMMQPHEEGEVLWSGRFRATHGTLPVLATSPLYRPENVDVPDNMELLVRIVLSCTVGAA